MKENKPTADATDFWQPFGEPRWRELGEATGASELQLRFAVLRFGGASATAAAKAAGYAGTAGAIRTAGYTAVRTVAVQNLLELAAVNAPEDARISDKEIDAKIAKLIRSADPNVSLKAADLHAKRQAARREIEAASGHEPTWNESAMEILAAAGEMGVGIIAVHALSDGVDISYSPLREIAPHIRTYWPDIWAKMLFHIGGINPDMKLKWVEYGDAPLVDLSKFAKSAPAKARHNGAARPVIESEEAASAAL